MFRRESFWNLSCQPSLWRWRNPKFTHPEPFTRHSTVDHRASSQIQMKDLAPKWDLEEKETFPKLGMKAFCPCYCCCVSIGSALLEPSQIEKWRKCSKLFTPSSVSIHKICIHLSNKEAKTRLKTHLSNKEAKICISTSKSGHTKGSMDLRFLTKQSSHGHGVCPGKTGHEQTPCRWKDADLQIDAFVLPTIWPLHLTHSRLLAFHLAKWKLTHK